MSEILEGDEWKHAADKQSRSINMECRTRAEQQAWIDEQYLNGKFSLRDWRFQFDIISLENTDGSFPPE